MPKGWDAKSLAYNFREEVRAAGLPKGRIMESILIMVFLKGKLVKEVMLSECYGEALLSL
jgi:hypothetical protein